MNARCRLPFVFLMLSFFILSGQSIAAPDPAESDYTEKGADTCIKCHDEDSDYPVFDIFKTKHGEPNDARTPFAGLQCEACHGPGGSHAKKVRPGEKRGPIINFGHESALPPEQQNKQCLGCHENQSRIAWKGSAHGGNDVACASCHTVHTPRDPVTTTDQQAAVCYACHMNQRAEFLKPSTHPVRFDQMACSDCHQPHGASGPALLDRPTLNETCFTCHAEKRGPFLWEHAPVAEDCTTCHTPHGSIHSPLLTKRPPLLCQQCHSPAGHPSVAYTPAGLPSANPSAFVLSGSCLNCHTQVHGSNHPSGVKLMR